MTEPIRIPEAWERLDIAAWRGPVLIIGATDSGKSTLARYLARRLSDQRVRTALLDADLGQNGLFLPTTMALVLDVCPDWEPPSVGQPDHVFFVGNNSPKGSEARVMLGLYRLLTTAVEQHAQAVVIDTSGFVDPAAGGVALKWAKIELCMPCTVVALQRGDELDALLQPLRHLRGLRLLELPTSAAVQPRSQAERRAYRAARYRGYFAGAAPRPVSILHIPLFPSRTVVPGQLAALEDSDGGAYALGLVERLEDSTLWLRIPAGVERPPAMVRLGDLRLDPETDQDVPI